MKSLHRTRTAQRALLCTMLASLAMPAFAHEGWHAGMGMGAGMLHPLTGADHLLAMLAVGLWSAQQRGAARLALPMLFLGMMAAGALAAAHGVRLPLAETGIAASVAALGLLVACAVRLPAAAAGCLVSLFALMHGHAHGAEMPAGASGLSYGAGFLLSTALLHIAGYGAGSLARQAAVRLAGVALAAGGAWMLLA